MNKSVAGYTWQFCWLSECCWQLLFLRQTTAGMVACLFALFGAFGAMLYGLSKLYRYVLNEYCMQHIHHASNAPCLLQCSAVYLPWSTIAHNAVCILSTQPHCVMWLQDSILWLVQISIQFCIIETHTATCRLIHTHGSLPSSILYVAFFLPTSINAAWLSVASGLGVLIVPVSYGSTAHVEAEAVILAIVVTAAGRHHCLCMLCTGT